MTNQSNTTTVASRLVVVVAIVPNEYLVVEYLVLATSDGD